MGWALAPTPMHEVAAHPQAVELLRLFADHVGAAEFEPLATTGVPLAVREDEASIRYLWLDRDRRAGRAVAVASSRRRQTGRAAGAEP
jgi:hypothetical protein